jgi:hypothetical protein
MKQLTSGRIGMKGVFKYKILSYNMGKNQLFSTECVYFERCDGRVLRLAPYYKSFEDQNRAIDSHDR